MPEIWGELIISPSRAILAAPRRIGLEKMTVGEILLGQRGSKKHFGIGVAKAAA